MLISNKETPKVVFVRPPYHLWPIVNESDNFLMPLSFPYLSAYLKQELPGISVKVIDCLPERIGHKTLRRILLEERPDFVGLGDSLPYIYEGIKVFEFVKEFLPDTVTLAGGHFHSHMPRYSLREFPQIDYIIRYEGEKYLADLIRTLLEGGDVSRVQSLAYRENSQIRETSPGPVIENLDQLPMPDYDSMPMGKYAPFGKLWPRASTIQGSRGCPLNCEYCSWSAQEGEHLVYDGKISLKPRIRFKSVPRVMEEIDCLYNKYGIRYLFWVDASWNFNTAWIDRLCTEIIKRGYKLGWWAFVRADLLIEQERLGVLEKMVAAGFKHALFGGERFQEREMQLIGKTGLKGTELEEACDILRRKYPGVFRQATFLTGIRPETRESLRSLGDSSRKAHLDFAAYHPLMPYPGTRLWEKANEQNWIEERDFSKYDMFHPVMRSEALTRQEIAKYTQQLYQFFVIKRPFQYLKGLFSPVEIRRKLHWWFLLSVFRVLLRDLSLSIRGRKRLEGFAAIHKLWKPDWYDT